ncbi:hypothetical protein [Wolbachia endosymbiont of Chironomus riparius]|uniref:hypothetical protein n=1 Tax=Wolbachia endosymbiont of Chironomus riparius TaxID=2883238 RepID=UPI0020A23181|nr:hypothetical protein [Wolbachia endosymbiont of Chironomus riparius]
MSVNKEMIKFESNYNCEIDILNNKYKEADLIAREALSKSVELYTETLNHMIAEVSKFPSYIKVRNMVNEFLSKTTVFIGQGSDVLNGKVIYFFKSELSKFSHCPSKREIANFKKILNQYSVEFSTDLKNVDKCRKLQEYLFINPRSSMEEVTKEEKLTKEVG